MKRNSWSIDSEVEEAVFTNDDFDTWFLAGSDRSDRISPDDQGQLFDNCVYLCQQESRPLGQTYDELRGAIAVWTKKWNSRWQTLQAMLCDSDGNHPDDEYFREAMIEFRDEGGIQGYWFCDISNRNENDLCWDEWNQAWDEDFRCGPQVDEIDFTGLEESR